MTPKHHTYSLGVIGLALDLANYACLGNRQVVKVLQVVDKYIGGLGRVPCYNTVRSWVAKRGYYQLCHLRASSCSATWAIIADLSVRVGGQRLLLVLGVNLEEYDFKRPLTFRDVRVLSIGLRHQKSWSAKAIKRHLEEQVLANYQVAYLVSDSGPCIKSAAQQLGLPRIDDVSHAFARMLKRTYNKRTDFETFIKKCTHVRRYNTINADSHLRPPKLRGTARFMNVAPLIKWATELLQVLDDEQPSSYKGKSFTARHRAKVEWLLELKELIFQLAETLAIMDSISHRIKHNGLCVQTVEWAKASLTRGENSIQVQPIIEQQILGYLEAELTKATKLKLPVVICSTDIVESFFGRYKETTPKGVLVTSHVFRITAYGRPIQSTNQVKAMMESVSFKKLKAWRDIVVNQDRLLEAKPEKSAVELPTIVDSYF